MSTVADLFADVRLEMTDEQATRWTDAQMLTALKKALRRISHVLHRNDIALGRSTLDFTLVAGTDAAPLPADFMVDYGLYRTDTKAKLTKHSPDSWEQLSGLAPLSAYVIYGDTLFLAGVEAADAPLRLIYWPKIDTALTTSSTMPWGGAFDDVVGEYLALRLKNIDEMDVSRDADLLQDMENNVLSTYAGLEPTIITRRGWLV